MRERLTFHFLISFFLFFQIKARSRLVTVICGAKFSPKGNLKKCICQRTQERNLFTVKSEELNFPTISCSKHTSVHTGEKRFHCEICRAKFSWNTNLQTHMSTHTGKKPFHSEICGAKYS